MFSFYYTLLTFMENSVQQKNPQPLGLQKKNQYLFRLQLSHFFKEVD